MFRYFKRGALKERCETIFGVKLRQSIHVQAVIFGVIVAVIGTAIVFGLPYVFAEETSEAFEAIIDNPAQIYDGDTIRDVRVKLLPIHREGASAGEGEIWPGLLLKDGYLYTVFDLRLAGIDTPEMRPSTRNSDGSQRSQASRDAEKAASKRARQALVDLLKTADYTFSISYPEVGKYAGRLVAEMWVRTGEKRVNVSAYMIENNYAKPYDGGKKPSWDFGQ